MKTIRPLTLLLVLTSCLSAQQYRTGWYRGERVTYQLIDGQAVMDGDILLERVDSQPPAGEGKTIRRDSIYITGNAYRWTGATIPYVIDSALPNQQRVLDAIAAWQGATPIRFTARVAEANYIKIQSGSGCNSNAGMIGGQQIVNLTDGCLTPQAMHELGHAIGLDHEQQRPDRDHFIRVNLDSMSRRMFDAAYRNIFTETVDGDYDYGSFMHYSSFVVGDKARPVFDTIPIGIPTEQGVNVSPFLVNTVKRMYNLALSDSVVTTVPPGLQIIVDGFTYTSPKSFTWLNNSTHTIEYPDLQAAGNLRYRFAHWSDSGARQHSVFVKQQGSVFAANSVREIKVGLVPFPDATAGSLAISPASSDGYYAQGSAVTLTATPASGMVFENFFSTNNQYNSGLGISANPATFILSSADATFSAGFRPIGYPITTLTANWPYANIGLDGSNNFGPIAPGFWATGTAHTAAAADTTISDGYLRFIWDNWADGGGRSRSVTHSGGSYTANFHRQFLVTTIPNNGGTVVLTPSSPDGFYDEGTTIAVTAVPSGGFAFLGWDRDISGQSNPTVATVNSEVVIGAWFSSVTNQNALLGVSTVSFSGTAGGANPASQSYSLTATANRTQSFSVTTQDPWVAVAAPGSTPATLTFAVDSTGLAPGRYRTPVRIIASNTINTPKIVLVEFNVDAPGCTFNSVANATPIPAGGGQSLIQVTASDPNCSWTASAPTAGVNFGPPLGYGSATVAVAASANSALTRNIPVSIGSQTVQIRQIGTLICTYSVSPSASVGAAGGTVSLAVTASNSQCPWTATSGASWLTPATVSGVGTSPANFTAPANAAPVRSGSVSVEGQTATVTQASGCTFATSATQLGFSAAGETVSLGVTPSNAACTWSATAADTWLTFPGGANFTGPGSIAIRAAANTGAARNGAATVAGIPIGATQAAGNLVASAPSFASIAPFSGSGANGSFQLIMNGASGWADINEVTLLFNIVNSPSASCYLRFVRTSSKFYIMNDAGVWLGPFTPGVADTAAKNAQCQFDLANSRVSGTGNDITLTFATNFLLPAFGGKRNMYVTATGSGGLIYPASLVGVWWPDTAATAPSNYYRLYSPVTRAHLFTTDTNEYAVLGNSGWAQEGTIGRTYDRPGTVQGVQLAPYYRIYQDRTQSHFWTTDRNEYLTLIKFRGIYEGEGFAGFILPGQIPASLPLYRLLYTPETNPIHHWTTDKNEHDTLVAGGAWKDEGIPGYLLPAAAPPPPARTLAAVNSASLEGGPAAPGELLTLVTEQSAADSIRVLVDGIEPEIRSKDSNSAAFVTPLNSFLNPPHRFHRSL